jgi:hypothetical protein
VETGRSVDQRSGVIHVVLELIAASAREPGRSFSDDGCLMRSRKSCGSQKSPHGITKRYVFTW